MDVKLVGEGADDSYPFPFGSDAEEEKSRLAELFLHFDDWRGPSTHFGSSRRRSCSASVMTRRPISRLLIMLVRPPAAKIMAMMTNW